MNFICLLERISVNQCSCEPIRDTEVLIQKVNNPVISDKNHTNFIRTIKKLVTLVKGDPKAPFSIATTPFPGLLHFTLDPYHIMLSAK